MSTIKTRFAPSPTGHLHVGSARTALFNYLLARRLGGVFLLRIEDTDRARHVEGATEKLVQDLRWLGIEWDEGFSSAGGPNGPYRQSERLEVYNQHVERLLAAGQAYHAFETPEELDALRRSAESAGKPFQYVRPDPLPSRAEADAAAAEGRPVVVRFKCPGEDVTIRDEVFGPVTVPAAQQDDFVIRKADGWPTYHLANVVDDRLMGVNFILRGQEFLGQTWRHALLRRAFGWDEPRYAHLPLILDMQGRKLSKRAGDVDVFSFRRAGYLPEAMVSFVAQLGFSPPEGRERLSLAELEQVFDVERIGKANAKFDPEKLLAFNTAAAAAADEGRLLEAFRDFLALNETPFPRDDEAALRGVLRSCAGLRTFADVVAKAGVLFADDQSLEYDAEAMKKVLEKSQGAGWAMLAELRGLLGECEWTVEALEALLARVCEAKGVGMGKVAQPIRVAVTGTTVSPHIYDTLLMLGREKALARIDRCLARKQP